MHQFKRWLRARIDELRWQDRSADGLAEQVLNEAYQISIDLRLPKCAAACEGPAVIGLLECLNAIPRANVFSPGEIAGQLGVSANTVRGWINSGQLNASNVATPGKRPRWRVKGEELDAFLEKRQPEVRPAKKAKRKQKLLVEKY